VAAEPLLPRGIAGDVGSVVIEKVHLDVALAGTTLEREFVGPEVRVVQRYVRAPSHVPLAGGIEGQEVRPYSRLVAGAVGPEITTGLPEWPQSVLVSNRVLHHQGSHPIGMCCCQAEPYGFSVVLHKDVVAVHMKELGVR
jgi:hypothetical protein